MSGEVDVCACCGDMLSSEQNRVVGTENHREFSKKKEEAEENKMGVGESVCVCVEGGDAHVHTYCLRLPFDYSLRYKSRSSNEFNRIDCNSANGNEWTTIDRILRVLEFARKTTQQKRIMKLIATKIVYI